MPGEHAVNRGSGARRRGENRGHRRLSHAGFPVLQRVEHLRERRLDAQVVLGEGVGRERLFARAEELLANPPVLVPPADGRLPEDVRGRRHPQLHEGHQQVPRALAHRRLEIAESIEHAGEEQRDVLAEEVGRTLHRQRRARQRSSAHLGVVLLEQRRDGVGEDAGVVPVGDLVALEVVL